ncbi:type 4a pilus biogenesis protein PilO [Selenomonas sp. oral taxon 138]|uniref:type 4a pilus biogenesis protein PilO n=1 Tax=Selenomonas sp. oral taxon 138 TaxID=712532 RepID=UPI0002A4239D|nr:type 4a pilus biogenesis protein PilO [Selenomonas sp. oral taxon 138]EKX99389.1 hypothetical protein HMPREF9163_00615 [Selenomonas sp. oral taxon 138 str. F0429]
MMERLSERQRIEIVLIFALALLLLYALLIGPYIAVQRDAARAERAAAETLLMRADAYQRTLLADGEAASKLRARQRRLADALPEVQGQGRFIHEVESLARRSGVSIVGVAPQPSEPAGEIAVQPIEFKFHGNYFDVLSFLRALQEGARCVQFSSFSLTAEGNELHGVLLVNIAAYAGAAK